MSRASGARPGIQGDTDVPTLHRPCRVNPGSRIFARAARSLVRDTKAALPRTQSARWLDQSHARRLNSRCQTAQSSSFPRRVRARGLWPCLVWCRRRISRCRCRRCGGRARRHLGDNGRSGPLMRGGRSADRRTRLFCRSRVRGATTAPLRRGTVPLRAGPLSALHRGDFRPETHAAVSGSGTPEPPVTCPRPGHEAWRTGSRTSGAAVRAAAPDATPRSACRIVSGDAPQERGCECLSQLRYVVNSEVESQSKFFACSAANLLRPGRPAAPSPREPHHRYGVGARDA